MSDPKVSISIILDGQGRLGVSASSKNYITVIGMIELAKGIILKSKMNSENDSRIVVPDLGGNGHES